MLFVGFLFKKTLQKLLRDCSLGFSHALNLNFLSQKREKRLVYGQTLISGEAQAPFTVISGRHMFILKNKYELTDFGYRMNIV